MKVLYWNVYVGHNPDHVMNELRTMIQNRNPEIIGLGEAKRVYPRLKNIKGYRAFTLPETYEGRSDTAALVRKDVLLVGWYWMKMSKWWIGPKHGKRQGPKRYWSGRIRRKGVWRISIGHWPFNLALEETEDRVARWFNRARKSTTSIHLGDLNMGPAETEQYVKRFNGDHAGHRIDRAMYRNAKCKVEDLGKHGSDHHAILFTFSK